MTLTPSLTQVIETALNARLGMLHTALPGTVLSYDAARQVAKVRPGVKQPRPTYDDPDLDAYETLPDVFAPVVWPKTADSFLALTLQEGDGVLLVACEGDFQAWRRSGSAGNPETGLRHDLANCIAIPGLSTRKNAIPDDAPSLQLGGAQDSLALASMLDKLIAVIKTWTPVSNDGGAALKAAVLAAFPDMAGDTSPTNAASTASARIRVDS